MVKKHRRRSAWSPPKRGKGEREMERAAYRFIRVVRSQYPIRQYFADLAFPDLRAVVEVDGPDHRAKGSSDAIRDAAFASENWVTVRVSSHAAKCAPAATLLNALVLAVGLERVLAEARAAAAATENLVVRLMQGNGCIDAGVRPYESRKRRRKRVDTKLWKAPLVRARERFEAMDKPLKPTHKITFESTRNPYC